MGDNFGHWLAGFIDGEGTFQILARGKNKTGYSCSFALVVRADDSRIMAEIQSYLGIGALYWYHYPDRADGFVRGPRCELRITKKDHIRRFLAFLDLHPLRAKKANDYLIWREAAMLWLNRVGHRGLNGSRSIHPIQEMMAALKSRLESGRKLVTVG